MTDGKAELKQFRILRKKLNTLELTAPAKAIKEARSIPTKTDYNCYNFTCLKACILVNAGGNIGEKEAILEGIEVFKLLIKCFPKHQDLYYNLANGLVALTDQESYNDHGWYLKTCTLRHEARKHFQEAISFGSTVDITARCYTNLGNALWKAHRWVEAYDTYTNALKRDPSNAIAATGALKILLNCIDKGIGEKNCLLTVAVRLQDLARQHLRKIKDLAGLQAHNNLKKLIEMPLKSNHQPAQRQTNEYEKFVISNRLALSPTIEGLDISLKSLDSFAIHSITESIDSEYGVPPIFAMFNLIKADFLLARFLAFNALNGKLPESGNYSNTLDYSIYGLIPAGMTLAQRACMDVLDKIAVATREYYGIKGAKRNITFTNCWFNKKEKGQPLEWHSKLRERIEQNNTAIIALAELSLDVHDGFLLEKKSYRNTSTHRFTVLHNIGCEPQRKSSLVDHCNDEWFKILLIESLQITRSAIIYFLEMIRHDEIDKENNPGLSVPMFVPDNF